jgi:hypothetical protein
MTTTVLSTKDPAAEGIPGPAPDGRRLKAVVALARFEARELLKQVLVALFFLAYAATAAWHIHSGHPGWHELTGREGMADYPALQDADRATQSGAMYLALAMFVCVNRAVLRSRRSGTDPHFDVLVMEPWRRTLAHALSVVPYALFTGLVVAARFGAEALQPGAVGHGSVFELAVAPLTVLLGGVAGVLLGRLVPSVVVGPFLVVVLYVVTTSYWVYADNVQWSRWLAPVVTDSGADPVPSDLVGRPAAWHALYLTGLAAALLCLALLRSGNRTTRTKALTAVALVATAAGVAGQSQGLSAALQAARVQVSDHPEKTESCTVRGATTYCALPEWTGRTGDWAKATARVRSLAGGTAATRPLTVRQRVEASYGIDGDYNYDPLTAPGTVTVTTRWGGNRVPEYAVGLASVLVAGDEKAGAGVCDGRVVTIMWLALGADPDPLATLRDLRIDDSIEGGARVLTPTDGLSMSAAQTSVVRALLDRPRQSVTADVKAHWTQLTAPRTTTAQVARLLHVPAAVTGKGTGDSCEK